MPDRHAKIPASSRPGPSGRPPALVRLPEALCRLFPEAERLVEIEAETVEALLDRLDDRWPGMKARVCDERPAIRRHMAVFVDGERADLSTSIPPRADVFILMAISGG